ncbi:nucleotidyltransferase family protein [Levilactobacillus cerevisiae]|uniref:hypothetical protein n=1 Tax=Levilactobacillus cerevisiae TaxID=1704076 RepID=UPI000F7A1CB1|nr:hypothetical protein [Levilactobacillus cerevisiae]
MIDLELLEQVIVEIRELYDLFTAEFYGRVQTKQLVNLKKLLVDDFVMTGGLVNADNYIDSLSRTDVSLIGSIERDYIYWKFQYRVKFLASLKVKVGHNLDKHRYVAKVVNDLVGTRIIVGHLNRNFDEVEEVLVRLLKRQVISRYYLREDGKYRAIHCYFQSENRYFPWELQIWDTADATANFREHARHDLEKGRS